MPMADDSNQTKTEAEPQVDRKQFLKLLIELGPLLVFFLVNAQAGRFIAEPKHAIFYGTGAFMVATIAALAAARTLLGRVPVMLLVSGAFIMIFGGLTLWLQDDHFIKVKPTIIYALFALILFVGLATRMSPLKTVFGDVFRLTEEGWRRLTIRWGLFFVALAILNELVWRNFSTDSWVAFKVFGIMPLISVFAVAQVGLLKRYELQ
jgi:intracellular septation protein